MNTGIIEIAPLAYMRGRTLSNAFVILDEAQNTNYLQMKMFLTRIGLKTKVAITGDITQIDLKDKEDSGLVVAEKILKGIEGIEFIYFGPEDVIRHPIVKSIIIAYDRYEGKKKRER
jgi:phosphate starvation-inducible PhoH-like protein